MKVQENWKTFGINVEHAVSKRSKVQTVCQTKRREYQVKTSFSSTKYDFSPVRVCFLIHNEILAWTTMFRFGMTNNCVVRCITIPVVAQGDLVTKKSIAWRSGGRRGGGGGWVAWDSGYWGVAWVHMGAGRGYRGCRGGGFEYYGDILSRGSSPHTRNPLTGRGSPIRASIELWLIHRLKLFQFYFSEQDLKYKFSSTTRSKLFVISVWTI